MRLKYAAALILAGLGSAPSVAADQWPAPLAALVEQGARVVGKFDAPGGLTGYATEYQGQAMAVYLLPDGSHAVLGRLIDGQGNDLSSEPLEELIYRPLAQEMWQRIETSHWIADGETSAPRTVYVFMDPNCPYCTVFWRSARPWVEAGKVQIRHIPVGMLREDSMGKAAALLASGNPARALHDHEQAGRQSKLTPLKQIPAEIGRQLGANRAVMHELGASATPAIFWLSESGRLQAQQGTPQPEMLKTILGDL